MWNLYSSIRHRGNHQCYWVYVKWNRVADHHYFAYKAIRNGEIEAHQNYMIYSYAVCFSAVTLRIWLPILTSILGDFNSAYQIIGWLSWIPNLIVAYVIINSKKRNLIL